MKKTIITIASAAFLLQSCTFVRVNIPAMDDLFSTNFDDIVIASDVMTTFETALQDFSSVDLETCIDVKYAYTFMEPGITITGPENYIDQIEVKVVDGKLIISSKGDVQFKAGKLKATMSSRSLEEVRISGAGDFETDEKLKADSFSIFLEGAGDVSLNSGLKADKVLAVIAGAGDIDIDGVDCAELICNVQGAGDIKVSGKANYSNCVIEGAGDIDLRKLDVTNVSKSVMGSGDIKTK